MKQLKKLTLTLVLLITAAAGAWAEESESITTTLPEATEGSVEFTGTHFKITGQRADVDGMNLGSSTNRTITISALNGEIITKVEMTISFKFYSWQWEVLSTKGNVSGEYTTGKKLTLTDVDVSEVTLSASNTTTGYLQFNNFKIFYTMPAGTMTLNTDNTVATMTMPANDVTVNYTLVRDLAQQVSFTGIPTGDGLIVKKNGEKYEFITAPEFKLIDELISDADKQNIFSADGITVSTQKKGEGDTWQALDATALAAGYAPGTYRLVATATDETSPYDGTVTSAEFTTVEKYDLTVQPADEYSKDKLDKVVVGTEEITPDANTGEATKTGIAPNTEVKIKAKRGYIIEKVEAKKIVPLTYPIALSAVTADYLGSVVTTDGNVYPAKTAAPAGKTAVGILGKVTETGHGLILALQDATNQTWNTINGWTSASYAGTTLKVLPDDDARSTKLTSYTTLGETAVSNWAVAQKSDYEAIFTNLGSTTSDKDGTTYDANVNAYIITGVGGAALVFSLSATGYSNEQAWGFSSSFWTYPSKTTDLYVRPVLGF